MGGMTFDLEHPGKLLNISNRVAARHFGHALLSRAGLLGSMADAVRFLLSTRDLRGVLSGYRSLME